MSSKLKRYEFGCFRVEPHDYRLLRNGEKVKLRPKCMELLLELLQNSPHLVTKEVLLEAVWHVTKSALDGVGGDSYENTLMVTIGQLRNVIGDEHIETVPGRGYRFVTKVTESFLLPDDPTETSPVFPVEFHPPVGALKVDSSFYITRATDEMFHAALRRQDSFVLLKGPRQVGKTSLLARGLQRAREMGAFVVNTDFQLVGSAALADVGTLLKTLGHSLDAQLKLETTLDHRWRESLPPGSNFQSYLEEVLENLERPLVWGMDEVDLLFSRSYSNDIFGLFRSCHNLRALKPAGPWYDFTVAMAYATEASLFISDLNQSPFNVGTQLGLADFALDQIAELNRRYLSILKNKKEIARYHGLVGGHPYLVHFGLYWMAKDQARLDDLEAQADSDEGPFGPHLRRLLKSLSEDSALCDALRGVLRGQARVSTQDFYRLRAGGVVLMDSQKRVKMRCELYATYLKKRLL